jgi:prolipoprotein diacylglyceryltransferase
MGYAVFRSIAEHFRGDYPVDHIHNGLTSAQVLSIAIFSAGAALWVWRARGAARKKEDGK